MRFLDYNGLLYFWKKLRTKFNNINAELARINEILGEGVDINGGTPFSGTAETDIDGGTPFS